MFGMSDAHHFRKMVAGFCMMFAPLFALVGFVVHPAVHSNESAQVTTVAAHMDGWYLSNALLFVSVVLAVPAALGLMHMLREREVAYGHVGGGLALIGLMALAGLVGMDMVTWQMGAGPHAEMASLLHRVNHATGVLVPFVFGSLLFGVGYLALGMGLYRARATASWYAVCLMVGGIALDVATIAWSLPLAIAAAAVVLVGQGGIGRMVWSESDDAWERTPEHSGFRALPGLR
ncbi:MAG: hypothetical protein ACJ76Z_15935 [Thermoleophilaceae bacterium]